MSRLILCVLLIAPLSVCAQHTELDYQANFASLIVSDMDRSVEWYGNVLDLQVMSQVGSDERGFKITNLQNNDFRLELIELQNARDPRTEIQDYTPKTRVLGFFKVGFQVAAFDRWIEHLNEKSVAFNGEVVIDPQTKKRMVVATDPDGNRIQFFEK